MSKMTIQQAAKALGSRFKPTPGAKLVNGKWVTLYTLDGKVVTATEVIAAVNKGKKLSMASRAQRYRAKLLSLAMDPAQVATNLQSKIGSLHAIADFVNKMAAQLTKFPGNAADLKKAATAINKSADMLENAYRELGDDAQLSLAAPDATFLKTILDKAQWAASKCTQAGAKYPAVKGDLTKAGRLIQQGADLIDGAYMDVTEGQGD